MRKSRISLVVIAATVLVFGVGLALIIEKRKNRPVLAKVTRLAGAKSQLGSIASPASEPVKQISLKNKSREQAMQVWWERREKDRQADWKVSMSFYGRIVDENMRPVPNATVKFEWTNISSEGTSTKTTMTDENGLFSLTGVNGKNLGVRIVKAGYLILKDARARSFEFADPSEQNYYEPNPDTPVLFQLRKEGEGAELVKKSVEVFLPDNGSSKGINLAAGKVQATGDITFQSFKPWPARPMSPHYDWKVSLSIPDGGFVEAHEEFPFEAPETVYEPTFEINMPASLGDAWKVSVEKTLYFTYGNPKKYGRLNLRTNGASRYVFIDYFVNPSGSRNLEEKAGAQTAKNP